MGTSMDVDTDMEMEMQKLEMDTNAAQKSDDRIVITSSKQPFQSIAAISGNGY